MKILHATPSYFSDASVVGGGERYVNNICSAIAELHDDNVIADILSFAPADGLVQISPKTCMHLVATHENDLLSCAGETLDRIIDSYDILHVHQCLLPWGLFLAARARLMRKVVVGTDHGGGEFGRFEQYPVLGDVFHAFHAQSQFATLAFLQFGPPVRKIYGPVDEHKFPLRRAARALGNFVAIGRILPHKGYENAIAALPSGSKLSIIGRPYDRNYLDHLRNLKTNGRVEFLFDLDDHQVTEVIEAADLYIHSATHRSFRGDYYAKPELLSLAPLEAMCMGVPALVSMAGALPELAENTIGCKSFKSSQELSMLLSTHMCGELFDVAPEEIRKSAIEIYGLMQFGEKYVSFLRELLDSEG
jgi:glycosyltransferase involved in cell wall biosynthesis